jgi:hypothetical protein
MGNGLPTWLAVAWTAAFAAILVVHIGHLVTMIGQVRLRHLGHCLMALGMVVMYWPHPLPPGGTHAGRVLFAVLTALAATLAAASVAKRRNSWLWPVATVDFAAMTYMFGMDQHSWTLATLLLAVWFIVEGVAWNLGWLREVTAAEALVLKHRLHGIHARSVRVTLSLMSWGMAFMLLAMQFGMSMPTGDSPMPGMTGM